MRHLNLVCPDQLRLPDLFDRGYNVICILQINQIPSSHGVSTQVLKTINCLLYHIIDDKIEEEVKSEDSLYTLF